ncbi:MAG: carboxylesterase family protein [Bacteroidales bacterium]|nr:carboxylesterase family protein [Bacteroidales bacterium]
MKHISLSSIAASLLAALALSGCQNGSSEKGLTVKCHNGRFQGMVEPNGVLAFKGIPYALPPVGELRWKAPQPAPESDELFQAKEFGNSAVQPYSETELASARTRHEDCLTLNIWTKDINTTGKPVMLWIHGGSYAFGGSSDPLYDGKYIVEANPDVVLVTINYRVNLMGFIDFSHVPGGEAFPDAPYLGILDQQMAMRWVKENIENFGGDPDNVTIFGESAGGGSVSLHLVAKGSEGLFKRAIAMSGTLILSFSQADYDRLDTAEALLRLTGSKNMDDLMKLSNEEILEVIEKDSGRVGTEGFSTLGNINNHPLRDDSRSIIPSDPFKALAEGASKDVDLIIGTTSEEMKYWTYLYYLTGEDGIQNYNDVFMTAKEEEMRQKFGKDAHLVDDFLKMVQVDQDEISAKFPKIWERTELETEMIFRMPALMMANDHVAAGGKGRTYMYYFGKGFSKESGLEWVGAGHACELTYAFNNLVFEKGGPYDPALTKKFSTAFANFARTGDPSQKGIEWSTYSPDGVNTMVIGKDCSMSMQETPRKAQADMLLPHCQNFYIKK